MNHITNYKYLFITAIILVCKLSYNFAQSKCSNATNLPFKADSKNLNIWNNAEYIPFFVKGCNLGVSVPGRQPGELEVTRAQYGRWFSLIKDAGFNSIRIYTLHYPHFYQVLDSFNRANPKNPLYFFQGVWLEEELQAYNNDLFFLNAVFNTETEENVDCVHGNRTIGHRYGKAYGTYTADVSRWNIGYIIGRETYPIEVLTTNQAHAADTIFEGKYLAVRGNPSEYFVTKHLNHLIEYEQTQYQTQRPVSYSSWPTLDPLKHPEEQNREEDTASIDLNNIDTKNAPAGCFASYHAYPYYPDFVGNDSINKTFADNEGQNSYLGYLTRLRKHYTNIPLIIAETSVPSSWGIAHYTSSGMNHGGFDEKQQGETWLRLLHSVQNAECAGSMSFAFMDEWFKKTWITDKIDYNPERRMLWHNVMSAEQNYGLIGFQKPLKMQDWAQFDSKLPITKIKAAADYDFFHINLSISEQMKNPDDLWIAIDTYNATIGESVLPTGDTVTNRAEFALHISNYSAELYVTQAYDIFGIWHRTAEPQQVFHSTTSTSAPWLIERWKNNNGNDQVQYVGNLKVSQGFLPQSTMDAIRIFPDSIHIRLPWSLLLFVDPSMMTVLNDQRSTTATEDTTSDGIQIAAFYHHQRAEPNTRFKWETWNNCNDAIEYKKLSYNIVKAGLNSFNNPAITTADSYSEISQFPYSTNAQTGVLSNDYDLDGNQLQAVLLNNPQHGKIHLAVDGSFSYSADANYVGEDDFEYCIFDGLSLSKPMKVCLDVNNSANIGTLAAGQRTELRAFPNPANNEITINASKNIAEVLLFSANGELLDTIINNSQSTHLNIPLAQLNVGTYFLKTNFDNESILTRICVVR